MCQQDTKRVDPVSRPHAPRRDEKVDEDLLHRAVADAGRWAFGTVRVEVWVIDDTETHVFQPVGGAWTDPAFRDCLDETTRRMLDVHHPECVIPEPQAPGVNLPGVLLSAMKGDIVRRDVKQLAKTHLFQPVGGACIDPDFHDCRDETTRRLLDVRHPKYVIPEPQAPRVGLPGVLWSAMKEDIVWRDVKQLAEEPDQPWCPHMKLLVESGVGWACVVPLTQKPHHLGNNSKGIVLYMAREGVDRRKLLNSTNETYLRSAALLVGAAHNLRARRQEAMNDRRSELHSAIRRARIKLIALKRMGVDLPQLAEDRHRASLRQAKKFSNHDILEELEERTPCTPCTQLASSLKRKVIITAKKTLGAGTEPPPPFTLRESLWTFSGVLLTLLMVATLNDYLVANHGPDYGIALVPFGAFVTLLYGVTAAPIAQPRNAMLGQILSISIGLVISYLDGIDLYIRQALATALAIGSMAKLGITHPPAGADALLFSSGTYGWANFAFTLVGNLIAIGADTIINNLNQKRKYPTCWGVASIVDLVRKNEQDDLYKDK